MLLFPVTGALPFCAVTIIIKSFFIILNKVKDRPQNGQSQLKLDILSLNFNSSLPN